MKHLPTLHLPLENEYKIVQTDASQTWWGGILLAITNIGEKKPCRYCSGTFNDYQKNLSSTDLEIEAIILVSFSSFIVFIDSFEIISMFSLTFGWILNWFIISISISFFD